MWRHRGIRLRHVCSLGFVCPVCFLFSYCSDFDIIILNFLFEFNVHKDPLFPLSPVRATILQGLILSRLNWKPNGLSCLLFSVKILYTSCKTFIFGRASQFIWHLVSRILVKYQATWLCFLWLSSKNKSFSGLLYHATDRFLFHPDQPTTSRVYVPSPATFGLPFENLYIRSKVTVTRKLWPFILNDQSWWRTGEVVI